MKITHEQAVKDLEQIMGKFETLGKGTNLDRAAQLVIQSIEVAYRRLDRALQLIYFEMGGINQIPPAAATILKRYVTREIDLDTARSEFEEIVKQYKTVFEERGITPEESSVLGGK